LSPEKAALPAPVIPYPAKVDSGRSGAGGEGIVASTVERVALGYCAEFATICGMNIALFGLGIIGSIWSKHYAVEGVLSATWNRRLKSHVACSELVDLKGPKLCNADFAPQFSVEHLLNDLRLARATVAGCGGQVVRRPRFTWGLMNSPQKCAP